MASKIDGKIDFVFERAKSRPLDRKSRHFNPRRLGKSSILVCVSCSFVKITFFAPGTVFGRFLIGKVTKMSPKWLQNGGRRGPKTHPETRSAKNAEKEAKKEHGRAKLAKLSKMVPSGSPCSVLVRDLLQNLQTSNFWKFRQAGGRRAFGANVASF